jgi:pyruvate-formate lyase-activating enzyme
MRALAARIDEADVRRLAELVARLSPKQQRVVDAVADGFRAGWLDPSRWERYWRACDLNDEQVLGDAITWLSRRRAATATGWSRPSADDL